MVGLLKKTTKLLIKELKSQRKFYYGGVYKLE